MKKKLKPLREQVIVITGASSGIGLATAKLAAREGARVVLAARSEETLAEVVEEIRAAGGEALAVAGDVGKREDVERIAAAALDRFGGFDTWVNNAGVAIYGRLEEVSEEDSRRLFDTNFWGLVHGSLVAARHLAERGGAIVNVGSTVSEAVVPLQGMYAASKHAVKGFTDALRIELEEERRPISVTLIKPGAIDTPYPQHARNYLEKEPKLPPPVYAPEEVARAIVHAAAHPIRDVFVGAGGKQMSAFARHAPRAFDRYGERRLFAAQMRDEPPRDPTGALYRAGGGGRVRGDHPGHVRESSLYTRAALHPVLTRTVFAVIGVAAAAWIAEVVRRNARPRPLHQRLRRALRERGLSLG